jgi:hypothetical protein
MGVIHSGCPHCGAVSVGMHTFGIFQLRPEKAGIVNIMPEFLAAAACPICSEPISAHIRFEKHPGNAPLVTQLLQNFQKEARTPESMGFKVADIWPKLVGPNVPADIPDSAVRAFLQAERNYLQHGNEDAAAIMYRKSLEAALKTKYPETTGTLAKRIDKLVEDKIVPADIGAWSHEIRIIGNDGAHDLEAVNRQELEAMRGFTDAVLRYLFTLPAQVQSRQMAK